MWIPGPMPPEYECLPGGRAARSRMSKLGSAPSARCPWCHFMHACDTSHDGPRPKNFLGIFAEKLSVPPPYALGDYRIVAITNVEMKSPRIVPGFADGIPP